MFTGIISGRGTIKSFAERKGGAAGRRLVLAVADWSDRAGLKLGASVACNGICLTVVEPFVTAGVPDSLDFDLSPETLSCTTAIGWKEGGRVNLERPLRMGDEFGGHMVSGHVDSTSLVLASEAEGDYTVWWFELPKGLERYIVPKGSVTIDGVSLTVNRVEAARFSVAIIPHTALVTGFGVLRPDDRVNLEVDLVAKNLARLAAPHLQE
ncbi:MAG: riboflavin synthase [Candidatus Pacebacteria bacterium]|nr:riboflavin synthase [Candidatus Paceibacterota bacterium]